MQYNSRKQGKSLHKSTQNENVKAQFSCGMFEVVHSQKVKEQSDQKMDNDKTFKKIEENLNREMIKFCNDYEG